MISWRLVNLVNSQISRTNRPSPTWDPLAYPKLDQHVHLARDIPATLLTRNQHNLRNRWGVPILFPPLIYHHVRLL